MTSSPVGWVLVLLVGMVGEGIGPRVLTAASLHVPGIRSISPVAGARLVLPESNVIIRVDPALELGARGLESSIDVTGSASGRLSGRTILSGDGRTVLFKPDRPFAYGERVTVGLRTPLVPSSVDEVSSFTIVPAKPPALSASLITELMSDLIPRSAPIAGAARSSVTADTLPAGFPIISSTVYQTPSPGRLFLSNVGFGVPNTPYLMILDDLGAPVFYRQMSGMCFDFKVQPNGLMTYIHLNASKAYVMDYTYTVVDSFACGNGYVTDVHEALLLANGHALLMSYDPQTVDMSAVVPGGNPTATVIGLIIQEVDDQQNVFFQWRSWDHFEITDTIHEDLTAARIDYVHGNAIEVDTDGNLLISNRHLEEITKIDRETGDVLWRWGGKRNQFTFIGDSIGFSYQHAIRLLPNANYTLWDNGDFHSPPFSRAVEYRLDQTAKTAELVWEHRENPDVYAVAMGYVQRLENGNTLISMGAGKPDIFEVSPDGSKVMQMTLPAGIFTYRTYRQDLPRTPPPPAPPRFELLSPTSPNPLRNRCVVTLRIKEPSLVSLIVYDLAGREVERVLDRTQVDAGSHPIDIDLTGRGAGLYFLKATAAGRSEVRKALLIR